MNRMFICTILVVADLVCISYAQTSYRSSELTHLPDSTRKSLMIRVAPEPFESFFYPDGVPEKEGAGRAVGFIHGSFSQPDAFEAIFVRGDFNFYEFFYNSLFRFEDGEWRHVTNEAGRGVCFTQLTLERKDILICFDDWTSTAVEGEGYHSYIDMGSGFNLSVVRFDRNKSTIEPLLEVINPVSFANECDDPNQERYTYYDSPQVERIDINEDGFADISLTLRQAFFDYCYFEGELQTWQEPGSWVNTGCTGFSMAADT